MTGPTQGLRIGIDRESRVLRRDGPSEVVANIANPRAGKDAQRRQLDLVQALNREHQKRTRGDDAALGMIESYELAFRMQAELPDLLEDTLVLWGGEFGRTPFAQNGAGREFRLTDVHGRVVEEVLA